MSKGVLSIGRTQCRRRRMRALARGALTSVLLAAAYLLAFELRFEFQVPADFRVTALTTLPLVVALKYLLLKLLGVQRHSWQFTSLWDAVGIAGAMLSASLLILTFRFVVPPLGVLLGQPRITVIPLGVVTIDLALSILALGGVRALRRLQVEQRDLRRRRLSGNGGERTHRVVIIGAGRAGALVARELGTRPDLGMEVVGFLDEEPATHGQRIHGLDVLGSLERLEELADEQHVEQAIITLGDASGPAIRAITDRCRAAGVEARIIPDVGEMLDGRIELSRLRPVRIEDLLRRDPVELDTSSIAGLVAGRCVLVSGAGGSIGAELCRQLVGYGPRTLVLVERAEGALWAIHRELEGAERGAARSGVTQLDGVEAAAAGGVDVIPAVADVCDAKRITDLLTTHRPTLVFHAAAHKHVPMMEANPGEAVKNNVLGTRVVADAALAAGVERFVLVSTDKAVNPSSVMGTTKRLAERYVHHLATGTGRVFVSVRFGNVLGSAGSVVPIFEQQIATGGPVTVTHPEMRRYFMTIPEASALVIQAAAVGRAGDILVLDMGEPVRIADLAHDLIRLSGLEPGADIEVAYSGIRPGEKLFEELALDSESTDVTTHPSILIARTDDPGWARAPEDLAALAEMAVAGDAEVLRRELARLVPEMRTAAEA